MPASVREDDEAAEDDAGAEGCEGVESRMV